jgi:hypothetical protein
VVEIEIGGTVIGGDGKQRMCAGVQAVEPPRSRFENRELGLVSLFSRPGVAPACNPAKAE